MNTRGHRDDTHRRNAISMPYRSSAPSQLGTLPDGSTMAVFGLATFHRATRPNIMECDYVASDPPIIVARICLALTAVFSVPVNHHPAREAVWSVLSGGSRQEMPTRVFFGETIVFFGLALLLGMFIKELSVRS